jgi:phosphatidylserine/phosphatidylglycerophosphate/cardiolipin synthase-like enzyme
VAQRNTDVLTHVLALARAVPASVLRNVAAQIEQHTEGVSPKVCGAITASVAQASYRAAVQRFMNVWLERAPEVPPAGVAWALRAAAKTLAEEQASESIELVWTGPNPIGLPLRRTDGALLEVIHAAQHTLTIVTFAAYKVPAVATALVQAAQRGVAMRIVAESAHASEGKIAYESIVALGADVKKMAQVYIWPRDCRPVDDAGHHGSLHVKCAVADASLLLVSSANLTHYALTLNMELGVLVRGGTTPGRVAAHLDYLIQHGVLVPLEATKDR